MHKRLEASTRKKEILKRIELEHDLFRYRILSGNNQSIYDACIQIRFYECMYEYFYYNEDIAEEYIKLLCGNDWILETLYRVYIKHEFLEVGTWKDISELLAVYQAECEKRNS